MLNVHYGGILNLDEKVNLKLMLLLHFKNSLWLTILNARKMFLLIEGGHKLNRKNMVEVVPENFKCEACGLTRTTGNYFS